MYYGDSVSVDSRAFRRKFFILDVKESGTFLPSDETVIGNRFRSNLCAVSKDKGRSSLVEILRVNI